MVSANRITPRQPIPVPTEFHEWEPPQRYIYYAMKQAAQEMRRLRMQLEDRTRPVDEYNISSSTQAQTICEVQPQFDQFSERIESILLTCSPPQTVMLQLGDRQFPVIMPATGVIVLGPLSMLLDRNMRRIATTTPAAEITMELMGWADERY